MFSTKKPVSIHILDIFIIQRQNETIYTKNKPIHCIGYRLDGSGVFYYKNERIPVKAGEAIYVPPCISYHQTSDHEKIIVIHFDAPELTAQDFSLTCFSDKARSDEKFLSLLDTWNSQQPGSQYRAHAILFDILADVQQESFEQNTELARKEQQLAASLEYLHQNYYKHDLNIRDIAAASSISEVYFRRLFQEQFQTSPWKYINNLRITKAMSLLKADDSPVKNIAASVGFSDPLYFSRVFKKATGQSPAAFRKLETYWEMHT